MPNVTLHIQAERLPSDDDLAALSATASRFARMFSTRNSKTFT